MVPQMRILTTTKSVLLMPTWDFVATMVFIRGHSEIVGSSHKLVYACGMCYLLLLVTASCDGLGGVLSASCVGPPHGRATTYHLPNVAREE